VAHAGLISIVHPDYPSKAPGRWFRNHAKNDPITVVTAEQCTGNVTEPRPLIDATCAVGIGGPTPMATGDIVMIAVFSTVGAVLVVGTIAYVWRRKQKSRQDEDYESERTALNN